MKTLFAVLLLVAFIIITYNTIKKGYKKKTPVGKVEDLLENINKIDSKEELVNKLNNITLDDASSGELIRFIKGYRKKDIRDILLSFLLSRKSEEIVTFIGENYDNFDNDEKLLLLEYLSAFGTEEAIELFMGFILKDYKVLSELPFNQLIETPRFVDIIFPRILAIADDPVKRYGIYELLNAYLENKLLFVESIEDSMDDIYKEFKKVTYDYERFDKKYGSLWMYNEPSYMDDRKKIIAMIKILGYFYDEKVMDQLYRTLKFNDNLLRAYALISLIKLGEPVDEFAITVRDICVGPAEREVIYNAFLDMGIDLKFPYEFMTQEYFAQIDLYRTIMKDTFIYGEPMVFKMVSEIEVSELFTMYAFTFNCKHTKNSEEKTYIGFAGPYKQEELSLEGYGLTYTDYAEVDDDISERQIHDMIKEGINDWLLNAKRKSEL